MYFLIFLTPEYEYSYSKDQLCFNEEIWKSVFGPQTQILMELAHGIGPEGHRRQSGSLGIQGFVLGAR